jgi:hypothetical protein
MRHLRQACLEESEKPASVIGWIESVLLIVKPWDHLRKNEECGAKRKNLEVKVDIAGEKRNQSDMYRSLHCANSIGEISRNGTQRSFPVIKVPPTERMRNTINAVYSAESRK